MSGSSTNSGTVNGTSTNVNLSGDSQQMLDGLVNVNVGSVTAVANVQDVLNNSQVQLLVQALNNNSSAQQNATQLTTQLQQQGKLQPDQQVIGVKDGKAVVAPKSMIKGGGTTGTSASGGTATSTSSGPGASTVEKNTGSGASSSGAPGASGWAHEKNSARKTQHEADKASQKASRDADKADTSDKGTGSASSNNQ